MLTWELVGAVVGAGLASGREIASFFTRHGKWSIVGIISAVGTLMLLAEPQFQSTWRKKWPERLWHVLLLLLLAATGGAMLSGAGEVAALMLPVYGAYWIGMAGTLLLAWFLAYRTSAGLAWVSRVLLCVLATLIAMGFILPPQSAAVVNEASLPSSIGYGVTYGGFNAALQASILSASEQSAPERKKHVIGSSMVILSLLLLGNTVLLRHPALMGEAMPFVSMMRSYGKLGYYISAVCLYLAILSTLTACLRGLGRKNLYGIAGIVLIALIGFKGVVETAYPVLGGACFAMLLVGKFTNYFARPFISRKDMV